MAVLDQLGIRDLRPRLSVVASPLRRKRSGPITTATLHYNGPPLSVAGNAAAELDFVVRVDVPEHQRRIGMDSLAYTFVVPSDGTIWQTRALDLYAAHCGNAEGNEHSLGVHLPIGTGQRPTAAQWDATVRLFDALRADYGFGRNGVVGHCEWPRGSWAPAVVSPTYKLQPGQSACPGVVLHRLLAAYRAADDGLLIAAPPRIDAHTFKAILDEQHSPAAPEADALYAAFVAAGVDPAVGLAFFAHESSYGKAGITADYETKNWGNVRTVEVPDAGVVISTRGGPFVKYPSWEAAVRDWCARLLGPRYAGSGLVTVEQVIVKYAPSSDANSPAAYAEQVRFLVEKWSRGSTRLRVTAKDGLKVRQGPNTRYPPVKVLAYGTTFAANACKDEGQGAWWHLVDGSGFVSPLFVEPA